MRSVLRSLLVAPVWPAIQRRFSWILNLLSILALVYCSWQFVRARPSAHSSLDSRHGTDRKLAPVQVGSKLKHSDVPFSLKQNTVVLVLSTGCPYCVASAAFYRAFIRASSEAHLSVVALLSDIAKNVGSTSLVGVERASTIRYIDIRQIGVFFTPTLLLVKTDGTVMRIWKGQLSEPEASGLFHDLGLSGSPHLAPSEPEQFGVPVVATRTLRALVGHHSTTIVDNRDRSEFRKGHIRASLNIPLDETETRWAHEVPHNNDVLVYCNTAPSCQFSATVYQHCGITHLRYIGGPLCSLLKAGIPTNVKECRNSEQ